MRVDLHTHTLPASACSRMSRREYVDRCTELGLAAIALTNHGDASDNVVLAPEMAARGVLLLHGVEISTLFGDFVIYSPDLEFLSTLTPLQTPLPREQVPDHAAVVWAHPSGGGGMSGSCYYDGLEEMVAPHIDAVEVYNGNWLDDVHVRRAERIAQDLELPATGGSDAHGVEAIMRCATEVDAGVASTADLVAAIRQGRVSPWRPDGPPRRRR
jgi:predicted metal-dependent phosphoesterase TrpH